MNGEKILRLYNGITGIHEDIIEDAQFFQPKKKAKLWVKWSAVAACLCVIVGGVYGAARLGLIDRMGGASGGGGGGEGITYMSYAGPVFPLSTLDSNDTLLAERNVNYDFSPYENHASQSIVTDSYVLTNLKPEEQTITLLYPFAGRLSDDLEMLPTITVNGETAETTLHIGPYSGGFKDAYGSDANLAEALNPAELDSWEKYRALLNADYRSRAFDPLPELTQPAVVYEISDMYGEPSEDTPAPTLNMEFTVDFEKTTILTYGFNGATNNMATGYCARDLFIPREHSVNYGESAYLIVLGDDISDYTLRAYVNGACDKEMENAGGTVTRYESTLGEIFAAIVKRQYLKHDESVIYGDDADILSTIPSDTFIGLAAELMYDYGLLSDTPAMRYDTGMLEEILSETRYMGRVMYLTFDVTIPEGGSMEISAEMVKKASMDFIGKGKDRNGYDMVTGLGSSLIFTGQTASVSNTEYIEIFNQNFGFDPENGVTRVELDLAQEHYYLEIRKTDKRLEKNQKDSIIEY